MSCLYRKVVTEFVSEVHVLDFNFVICEVQVEFGEPSFEEFRLDGKSGAAYAHAVAETEYAVVLFQVLVDFGGEPVH